MWIAQAPVAWHVAGPGRVEAVQRPSERSHPRREGATSPDRRAKNVIEIGTPRMVTIIEGDAHEQVARAEAAIDTAFIDADRSGYVHHLNKLLLLVRPGRLILAHNVDMVPDYVRAVTTSAELETIFCMDGGSIVTLKKRSEFSICDVVRL